jgi:hypothetical protein
MKYVFYGLFICIFYSCNTAIDKHKSDIVDSIVKAYAKRDSLIKHFRPIIQGVWDNEDFTDKVRSQLLQPADSINPYITTMDIEVDRIFANELIVAVGYSDGRGDDFTLKFQSGKRPNSIICENQYELVYRIVKSDTVLYLFSKEQGKTNALKFRKVLNYFPRFQQQ